MVPGFSRSISLPLSPKPKGRAAFHVRSVSLPCRSHPLISHLEEQIRAVRSWSAEAEISAAWIEAGLAQIEQLQTTLDDFLRLATTQETLRRSASTDPLLNSFLSLADSYGSFLSAIVALKQQQSEIQSAFRRSDATQLSNSFRSERRIEKELAQLASTLRGIAKCKHFELGSDTTEAEMAGILTEAIGATALASVAVFSTVAAMSATARSAVSAAAPLSNAGTMAGQIKKIALNKKRVSSEEKELEALERLEELEECIGNVECCSERVFRRLVNTRVTLLNINTPF